MHTAWLAPEPLKDLTTSLSEPRRFPPALPLSALLNILPVVIAVVLRPLCVASPALLSPPTSLFLGHRHGPSPGHGSSRPWPLCPGLCAERLCWPIWSPGLASIARHSLTAWQLVLPRLTFIRPGRPRIWPRLHGLLLSFPAPPGPLAICHGPAGFPAQFALFSLARLPRCDYSICLRRRAPLL